MNTPRSQRLGGPGKEEKVVKMDFGNVQLLDLGGQTFIEPGGNVYVEEAEPVTPVDDAPSYRMPSFWSPSGSPELFGWLFGCFLIVGLWVHLEVMEQILVEPLDIDSQQRTMALLQRMDDKHVNEVKRRHSQQWTSRRISGRPQERQASA